jgi:RNA polymerase sigma-70 factor (ECF subfamily)
MTIESFDSWFWFPSWNTPRVDEVTAFALRGKAGDRRALEQFVAATRPDITRLCRYLGYPADPDDLTQETYERALGALHRFRGDGSGRAWLLAIARRVCVDATRRAARGRRLAERVVAGACREHHCDSSWLEIAELLATLDPERREAFVLTQIIGMSYEETAEALGCPIGTIRSRVARARKQMLGDQGVRAAFHA